MKLISKIRWSCGIEATATPKNLTNHKMERVELEQQLGDLLNDKDIVYHHWQTKGAKDESSVVWLSRPGAEKWEIWCREVLEDPYLGERTAVLAIRSPIMTWDRAAMKGIDKVLEVLHSNFQLKVNPEHSFHVWIGFQEEAKISLRTAKNVALIVTGFEEAINTYHPDNRVNNLVSILPSEMHHLKSLGLRERLAKIEKCDSMDALISLMHVGQVAKFAAYNFEDLVTPARESQEANRGKGICFHQHQGTMKISEIIPWANFTVSLVYFAARVSKEKLQGVLDYSDDMRFSILHLVDEMGDSKFRNLFLSRPWYFRSEDRRVGHMTSLTVSTRKVYKEKLGIAEKPTHPPNPRKFIDSKTPLAHRVSRDIVDTVPEYRYMTDEELMRKKNVDIWSMRYMDFEAGASTNLNVYYDIFGADQAWDLPRLDGRYRMWFPSARWSLSPQSWKNAHPEGGLHNALGLPVNEDSRLADLAALEQEIIALGS